MKKLKPTQLALLISLAFSAPVIMAQQATRQQRLACADVVILNEGIDLTQLQAKVHEMWTRFGL